MAFTVSVRGVDVKCDTPEEVLAIAHSAQQDAPAPRVERRRERETNFQPKSPTALDAIASVLKAKRGPMEVGSISVATGIDPERVRKHLKVLRAAKRVRLHRSRVGGSAYSTLEAAHEVSSPQARSTEKSVRAPERGDAPIAMEEDADGSRPTTAMPLAAPSVRKKIPPRPVEAHTVVWSGATRKPVPGSGGDQLGQLGSSLNPNAASAAWPSFRKT